MRSGVSSRLTTSQPGLGGIPSSTSGTQPRQLSSAFPFSPSFPPTVDTPVKLAHRSVDFRRPPLPLSPHSWLALAPGWGERARLFAASRRLPLPPPPPSPPTVVSPPTVTSPSPPPPRATGWGEQARRFAARHPPLPSPPPPRPTGRGEQARRFAARHPPLPSPSPRPTRWGERLRLFAARHPQPTGWGEQARLFAARHPPLPRLPHCPPPAVPPPPPPPPPPACPPLRVIRVGPWAASSVAQRPPLRVVCVGPRPAIAPFPVFKEPLPSYPRSPSPSPASLSTFTLPIGPQPPPRTPRISPPLARLRSPRRDPRLDSPSGISWITVTESGLNVHALECSLDSLCSCPGRASPVRTTSAPLSSAAPSRSYARSSGENRSLLARVADAFTLSLSWISSGLSTGVSTLFGARV